MGIIIWLIVGGIVGWLASIIMRRDAQQGIILNIVVGIVGALIAGFLFGGGINDALPARGELGTRIQQLVMTGQLNLVTSARITRLEAAADGSGVVHALRGPAVASVQGHLESVLSSDGLATLRRLVGHALGAGAR